MLFRSPRFVAGGSRRCRRCFSGNTIERGNPNLGWDERIRFTRFVQFTAVRVNHDQRKPVGSHQIIHTVEIATVMLLALVEVAKSRWRGDSHDEVADFYISRNGDRRPKRINEQNRNGPYTHCHPPNAKPKIAVPPGRSQRRGLPDLRKHGAHRTLRQVADIATHSFWPTAGEESPAPITPKRLILDRAGLT